MGRGPSLRIYYARLGILAEIWLVWAVMPTF